MDQKDFVRICEESTVALHSHLERCSVACIDVESNKLSSGTLILIGHRLFVATTAHTIPRNPNRRLWVLGAKPQHSSGPRVGFLRWGKSFSDPPDVGFLELNKNVAKKMLAKEPCGLDSVADIGWGRAKRLAFVIGTPSQLSKFAQNQRRLIVLPLGYGAPPIKPKEWEQLCGPFDKADLVDPCTDIFLGYTSKKQLPDPGGTSGGGIWDQGFASEKLWHPEKARLFGIQTAWGRKQRYLRGVQIIHWLRLIYRDYPDLRNLLSEKFPDSRLEQEESE